MSRIFDPASDPETAGAYAAAEAAAHVGSNGSTPHDPKQRQSKPLAPPPRAVSIMHLARPGLDDPAELIRHRFLCRGGGLLLVGPTGVGKSSLSMQLMMSFALGRECLGFAPARPLKSLLVQAENDEGDLAEFRDGVLDGLNLGDEERAAVAERVIVATEDARAGDVFCLEVLAPLLEAHAPDILWIDPALAFIEGEANSQKDVGGLLRRGINPLVHRYECGVVVVHHTPKPLRSAEAKKTIEQDFAYSGAGSAEWANWSRATITLDSVSEGVFRMIGRKRGSRLRWRGADDGPTTRKTIAHCRDAGRIWWEEVPPGEEPEEAAPPGRATPPKTVEDLMQLVPLSRDIGKASLQQEAQAAGINERAFRVLLTAAVEQEQLFEWRISRKPRRPAVHFARFPQPTNEEATK